MAHETVDDVLRLKRQMRAEASGRRAEQPDAKSLSRAIFERLVTLPEYARAQTLMFYVDVRSEVRTRWFLPTVWAEGKRVVVPYCEGGEIELFRLDHLDELAPGMMDVPEPKHELRECSERKIVPSELDLIIIPGLAFDRRGGRLGYGKGYYDRLLHQIRNDATKVAVCFECQLVSEVPLLPHDVRMDMVVTENAIYESRGY